MLMLLRASEKIIEPLTDPNIHLISVSGHKLFAPKGIGAAGRPTSRDESAVDTTDLWWRGKKEAFARGHCQLR